MVSLENIRKSYRFESQSRGERFSDSEMANLLSAMGNNEAKGITLLAMADGQIYSRSRLHHKINTLQGHGGWDQASSVAFDYCTDSLVPIGFLAEEVILGTNELGYAITEEGLNWGIPLDGLDLDLSLRHKKSLYEYFGGTWTSKQSIKNRGKDFAARSPGMRLQIYRTLSQMADTVDMTDLVDRIGGDLEVYAHIKQLHSAGIIHYRDVPRGKSRNQYRFTGDDTSQIQPPPHYTQLTSVILEMMRERRDKVWNSDSLIEEYTRRYPDQAKKRRDDKYLRHDVNIVISHLSKSGVVEVERRDKGVITLDRAQRQMIGELVDTLTRFQNLDPEIIEYGRRRTEEILARSSDVRYLMKKAQETSRRAFVLSKDDLYGLITRIIMDNPDCTTEYVWHEVERFAGKQLERKSVRRGLGDLEKTQHVIKDLTQKGQEIWSISEV